MATKAGPYLYRRFPNSIALECTFEDGTKLVTTQGGYLEFDASWKPAARAKAPSKPRKPSTRVFLDSLPLTSSPVTASAPVVPVVGVASACGVCSQDASFVASNAVAVEHKSAPARLTPSQVRTLETAIAFGIATPEASAKFDAWRAEEARKNLEALTARQHPLAWLRRILSPSIGKDSK